MVSFRSHLARIEVRSGHWRQAGVAGLILCALSSCPLHADDDDPLLNAWLNAHNQLETWSAEVIQTRYLAALAQPLMATGQVFFCKPGLFRWELGHPPETIAIRATNTLLMVYPQLERAERYTLDEGNGGALRDVLTLMEAGFPKDEKSLRQSYSISTQALTNGLARIVLQPNSATARRLVTRVALTFQTNVFSLDSSEIEFADGSRLLNQFGDGRSNERLEPTLFSTNLPATVKIVEPLKP